MSEVIITNSKTVIIIFNQIPGLRLIVGPTTDAQEAGSLSHNRENIDIYSNSWGPFDDGEVVGGPRPMTVQALREGSTEVLY